jgi:hypothetical protein
MAVLYELLAGAHAHARAADGSAETGPDRSGERLREGQPA